MTTAPDLYEDVALVYTHFVRQASPEAAGALEQIHATFGAHAALRAALIITLLKMEVQQSGSIPEMSMYTFLLKDSPEAIPMLKDALSDCLKSWGFPPSDKIGWERWQQTPEIQAIDPQNAFDDLAQRVRQHSPITAIKLEQIYRDYGLMAGCYAATAVIWLDARGECGYDIPLELTGEEIRKFTFYQYIGKNAEALDQFIEMLECYRIERRPARVLFPQVASVHSS